MVVSKNSPFAILIYMDIGSHGLWGGIAFGRRSRRSFWTAFVFGALPDFIPFAPFVIHQALQAEGIFNFGPHIAGALPGYVYEAYSVTHSLVVFAFVYGIVRAIRGRPVREMRAWGLHVLMDIPFHSKAVFPTPFLWPLSDYSFDGVLWSTPVIFIPNIILLLCLYIRYYYVSNKEDDSH